MIAPLLIQKFSDMDINIKLKDGRLSIDAPKGALTPALKEELKLAKHTLIEYLNSINTEMTGYRSIKANALPSKALSFSQQRLWLLDKMEGGSVHYNLPFVLRLVGELNIEAASAAINMIVKRHESLRTQFTEERDGQPQQTITPFTPINIQTTDISELPNAARQHKLEELISTEAKKPFILNMDLMLRAQFVKVEAQTHMLLVTLHHIASDGWSMGVLVNEFKVLYSAYVQGHDNPLPELEIQYSDYAHWQRDWLHGEILEKHLGYWETQLADLPLVHNIPLDYTRPKLQGFKGHSVCTHIELANYHTFNTLCKSVGATLFMGIHAVFSVLLSRYSNETDIVIGTAIANREQAEISDLIGFFMNTLVLRSDLSEAPNFMELLNRSKNVLLDAYAHQQVPFEQVVERLKPERHMSHAPLFQVMLLLQNDEQGDLVLPGLTLNLVEQKNTVAKYDLTLTVAETKNGLKLNWEFNTDLFSVATIARMGEHFKLLFKGLSETPNVDVFSVNMLTDDEQYQLLSWQNGVDETFRKDVCIHQLFEEQAKMAPDNIALMFESKQLTYRDVNEQANQLANYLLASENITPDTLIGVCLERSFEMVIAILAILKAGGGYVPLEPHLPKTRLAYMIHDASLEVIITQQAISEDILPSGVYSVCLDAVDKKSILNDASRNNPNIAGLSSSNLAYVIYTSGSTGQPKGVMIEHLALLNRIDWMQKQYGCSQEDRILQKTPYGFDVSVWEFLWTLSSGASLVIAKPNGHKEPEYLCQLIQEKKVTKLHFVPSMLASMLFHRGISECSSIKQVFCSGEVLAMEQVDEFESLCPNIELHNLYGPTEAAIDVSYWNCKQKKDQLKSIPIGKPIQNTYLKVVNDSLTASPSGVIGELLIGGVGLARGYLNNQKLSAQQFIMLCDKNDKRSCERFYKTGDLVRWLPSGDIEYIGRKDHQVKIRGFRIELGEIESALIAHKSITNAVVADSNNAAGEKHLIAYIVANEVVDEESQNRYFTVLRDYLALSLPDYMVPKGFILLKNLPISRNGKIDRKALPEFNQASLQTSYVPPSTELEEKMCGMWEELLGVTRVGTSCDFFDIGGNSLQLMRFVAWANDVGVCLNAADVWKLRTINKIVESSAK